MGTIYKVGVVVGMELLPQLELIKRILVAKADQILFVCQPMETICFIPHLHAYKVNICTNGEIVTGSFNLYDYKPLSVYFCQLHIIKISYPRIIFDFLNKH